MNKMLKLKGSLWAITLLISLFITVFGNFSFWKGMQSATPYQDSPLLFIAFFVIILTLINLILTLFSFKPLFKIVASVMLLTSAVAAYFMDSYSVMIDKGMVQNVFATDVHETSELLSLRLVITVFLLGVLPVFLLYQTKINYPPFFKGLMQKMGIVIICFGVIVGTLYSDYKEVSFFGREHRELRHLINPVNYISSLKSLAKEQMQTGEVVVQAIGEDAKKHLPSTQRKKPSLVILVLGETARAMDFSLNGYERNTNPLLLKEDIINFTDVSSCGTATAVSVPCMFSKFKRVNYSNAKGKQFENLLDVIDHAGYQVLWRDNNSGCQGTCKRIPYESLARRDNPKFCNNGNCIDEILLDDLQNVVNKLNDKMSNKDQFIVLHQKGNHGPTYHLRYPPEFEVFKPACKTNQLQSCSTEEVVNAYDNAILYTDYFLAKTIDFLKQNTPDYDTAMMYISDHGESLGEDNLYLHGLPYMLAPDTQKKVPFLVWLSEDYQQTYALDKACIANKSADVLSHDHLFSSVLGLLAIQTEVHDSKMDIFASCQSSTVLAQKLRE